MVEFDLSKITGREPPVETDEDMMNALADALGDADALRTERDALRERNRELATLTNELRAKSAALANELRAADEALGDYTVNIIRSLPEAAAALRARVAELEVIAISICAGNCLPPFPCAQDGCPKRASASAGAVPK